MQDTQRDATEDGSERNSTANGIERRLSRRKLIAAAGGGIIATAASNVIGASAAQAGTTPEFWYQDNNMFLGGGLPPDFFSRYDQVGTWAEARAKMHTYRLEQLAYQRHKLSDKPEFVGRLAAAHSGIDFCYNVTEATAWWWAEYKATGEVPPGPPDYSKTLNQLRRLRTLGLNTTSILLQSVLTKPGPNGFLGYGLDRRIRDVVEFFSQIKPAFPDVRIGIIDPLPSRYEVTWQEAYQWLQADLADQGFDLDCISFDKPFDRPRNQKTSPTGITWTWDLMVEVTEFVQNNLGIAFGLQCADEQGGRLSNNDFRRLILHGIAAYLNHGGRADRYTLTPFHPYPDHTIPDTLGPLPPEGASELRLFREIAEGPAAT